MKDLESTNAFLGVMGLGLSIIMIYICWKEREHWRQLWYQAALATIFFHLPTSARQFLFWYGRRFHEGDILWSITGINWWITSFLLIVSAFGMLCKVRVFSLNLLGHGAWIALGLVGAGVALATRLL